VLGHQVNRCARAFSDESKDPSWSISLQGIENATQVDRLVGDRDVLEKVLPVEMGKEASTSSTLMSVSGILLLDRGIPFEDPKLHEGDQAVILPPETGLVIFPPMEDDAIGAISALQMAEGTFSCPKGMYLVYLTASVKPGHGDSVEASKELQSARNKILRLASTSKQEWQSEGAVKTSKVDKDEISPLMECYYTSVEEEKGEGIESGTNIWSAQSSTTSVATSLDEATLQAENLFWDIMGKEKRSDVEQARRKRKPVGYSVGQGLGGVVDGAQSEVACDFFPPEDRGGYDDDDE
jgi:hypothetical protein